MVEVCIVAEDGFDEECPVGFPLNLTLQISEGLGSLCTNCDVINPRCTCAARGEGYGTWS